MGDARARRPMAQRHTIQNIRDLKTRGEKIAMVTAYDATFARLFDEAGADMLLVGDSLGMVIQGLDSTLPVTMDHMVYHTRAVARGSQKALVVGDMPFMSYQSSIELAMLNAGRLMAEGGAGAVKLEGGERVVPTVKALVDAGIPTMGHLGLTPQSVHTLSGFKVQGRNEKAAARLIEDAMLLEDAGAFAIVLETIPLELAKTVSERLSIPTIGIGAGPHCDGQVLVCYDLLGLYDQISPKFVKRFGDLATATREATRAYVQEVKGGAFPADEHSFR
jgi:3-methyl-2-oxobutanoate hydroxymethyltransferase